MAETANAAPAIISCAKRLRTEMGWRFITAMQAFVSRRKLTRRSRNHAPAWAADCVLAGRSDHHDGDPLLRTTLADRIAPAPAARPAHAGSHALPCPRNGIPWVGARLGYGRI